MKSKFLVVLTLIFALCYCAVYAEGVNVDSGINFVSDTGDIIRTFPDVTNSDYTMYATVNVKNETDLQTDLILFVSIYDGNNNLKKLLYDTISAPANGEDIGRVPVIIPQGTEESAFICKAYLWDTVAGKKAYRTESVFLDFNTNLYGITIDGVDVADYSDDTDVYSIKVSKVNSKIKVYPKSGATSVQYNEINVPGTSKIKLSDGANTRNITIKTYLEEKDKYTLSALKYKIGDTEYLVEGFDPDIQEYTVNLPDNTFYVALLPEAMGEVTCTIQDINDSPNVINGVSFGKMRTDTTGPSYVYERKAVKGVVPIKNESTKAFVNVTDGEKTTEYTINFRAVQPRLTELNLVGADGDHYVPVFTSGAGFNNDNGTICVSDRMWAAANISKKLIGASYFMSPYNNKGGGQWWNDVGAKGDEYFNFTADTAGTVYLLGSSNISEYSGWEKVNNGTVPTHPKDYTLGDKTWNDYDDTDFFMSCVKWNSDRGRCDECGVGTMQESQISYIDGCVQYKYAFAKHFEAGEQVSIKHTGEYGNSAAEIIWAVVWDVDVNYPVVPDTGDEETGDDDEPGSDEGDIKDIPEYGESTYTDGYYVPGSSGSDYVTLTISGSQDEGSEHIQTAVLKSGVSSVPAGENAINVGGALGKIKLKNKDNYGAKTLHCKYTFVESSSPILMRFQYQTSTNDGSPKDTFTMTNEGVTFGDASVSATAPYDINIFQNVATGITVIYVNDEILYDGRETGDNLWGSESDHWHQFRFRTVEEDSAFRLVVKNMHHEVYSEEVLLTEVINYVMAEEETGNDNTGEDPVDPPVTPDQPGEDEEIKPGPVLELDAANNTGDGIFDETATSWTDLSENGYNVTLTDVCEWSGEALCITNGSRNEAKAVLLNDNINATINSYNFTVEFDIENIDEGAVVAASKNEEFSICEEDGKLAFYFAGIVKNTISVSLTDVLAGYNQITVSCDTSNNVSIKWYIDGELKSEKTVTLPNLKSIDSLMLGSYDRHYTGSVAIKRFRVFDYAKTAEDITE